MPASLRFNNRRVHSGITDDASYVTPAEFEASYYNQKSSDREPVIVQN
ncbi:MAG: hypothetical protein R2706_15065 [Acidimicrobiales bacterium]